MTGQVVVHLGALDELRKWLDEDDGQKVKQAVRAVLSTAVPVERRVIVGAFSHFWAYVAIADRSASMPVFVPREDNDR